MNIDMNMQTVKKIIKEELPGLMEKDRKIRQWILRLSKEQITKKTDKIETKMESRFDRLLDELKRDREAQTRKWEEQNRKWEDQNKKWEENQEEIRKLYRTINQKYESGIGALGARWGLRSEASFRNALKGILEDIGLKVEHIDDYDKEGGVYGRPSSVEFDIIIKNSLLWICELKSSMSKSDMFTFYKKTIFYEKKYQRKGDRLVVISPMVDDRAREVARELGITIYSYAHEIEEEL